MTFWPPYALPLSHERGIHPRVNTSKAARPVDITVHVLKTRASQQADINSDICDVPQALEIVPICCKTATFISLP